MISQLAAAGQMLLTAGKDIPDLGVTTQQGNLGANKALEVGGITAGIGMIVVFIGLILLIVLITVFSAILRDRERERKSERIEPVHEAAVEAEMTAPAEAVEEDDASEIAAVIAAAIAMMDADARREQPQRAGFIVRSIRRVGATSPAWNRAARRDALRQP